MADEEQEDDDDQLADAVAEAMADAVEELAWAPIADEVRGRYDRALGLDVAPDPDVEALVRAVRRRARAD